MVRYNSSNNINSSRSPLLSPLKKYLGAGGVGRPGGAATIVGAGHPYQYQIRQHRYNPQNSYYSWLTKRLYSFLFPFILGFAACSVLFFTPQTKDHQQHQQQHHQQQFASSSSSSSIRQVSAAVTTSTTQPNQQQAVNQSGANHYDARQEEQRRKDQIPEQHEQQQERRQEQIPEQKIEQQPEQLQQAQNNNELLSAVRPYETPLIVFTCHRAHYLQQTLDKIAQFIPADCSMGCPVIISHDSNETTTTTTTFWNSNSNAAAIIPNVVEEFRRNLTMLYNKPNIPVLYLKHSRLQLPPPPPEMAVDEVSMAGYVGAFSYQALSTHYKWGLDQVLNDTNYRSIWKSSSSSIPSSSSFPSPRRVLILEEDLQIAVDFFDYFKATVPLLDRDPTLYTISAFNDNGQYRYVFDPTRLLRSDFFPGLGWIMTKELWSSGNGNDNDHFQSKWPDAYWDDWMREPAQRRGRHSIRPEVSRTFHFGFEGGSSGGQFSHLLRTIALNDQSINWTTTTSTLTDLSYLQPETFQKEYWNLVMEQSKLIEPKWSEWGPSTYELIRNALEAVPSGNVRIEYTDQVHFESLAFELGIMNDEKAGVPRTAYKGIVELRPSLTKQTQNYETTLDESNNNNKSLGGGRNFLFLTPPKALLEKTYFATADTPPPQVEEEGANEENVLVVDGFATTDVE